MKYFKIGILVFGLLLNSCSEWFVNQKTSAIAPITVSCDSLVWPNIIEKYSPDSTLKGNQKIIKAFQEMPFRSEVLYFNDSIEEFVGISTDHYEIRYIYNSKITPHVLDGLSPELKENDVKRIKSRMDAIFMKYNCK